MNLNLPFACGILLCSIMISTPLGAEEKSGFAAHPFFKLLVGEWKTEGVLKSKEGREVKIVEEWTGKVTDEGEFVMKGQRQINEDRQEYEWTFSRNSATGLVEAVHHVANDSNEAKRFEVSISEIDLTMELKHAGDNQSAIILKDSFPDKNKDTLQSEVTLTGDTGETTLSGSLTHKRVKKP